MIFAVASGIMQLEFPSLLAIIYQARRKDAEELLEQEFNIATRAPLTMCTHNAGLGDMGWVNESTDAVDY